MIKKILIQQRIIVGEEVEGEPYQLREAVDIKELFIQQPTMSFKYLGIMWGDVTLPTDPNAIMTILYENSPIYKEYKRVTTGITAPEVIKDPRGPFGSKRHDN